MNGSQSLFQKLKSQSSGDGLRAQLLRGGVGSIALKASNVLLSLGMAVVLARTLGTTGYGIYSYVFALVSLIAIPAQFGLPTVVVRETAKAEANEQWSLIQGLWRWASWVAVILSLLFAVAGGAAAWLFADSFTKVQLVTFGWGLVFVPMLALGRLRAAALRGLRKVVQGQLPEQVIRPALLIGFIIVFSVLAGDSVGPGQAMALHALAAGIAFAVGAWLLKRSQPAAIAAAGRQKLSARDSHLWLASSVPLALIAAMQFANTQIDILMLGMLGSAESVGVYRVAARGATVMIVGFVAVRMVIMPHLARFYEKQDMAQFQKLATAAARVSLAIAIPAVIIFAFFGSRILEFVFGSAYTPAYFALVVLSVAQLVKAAFGSIGPILNMSGHERDTAKGVAFALACNIVLNAILIPLYGINGAALATAASIVLWRTGMWLLVRRRLGVDSSCLGLHFSKAIPNN